MTDLQKEITEASSKAAISRKTAKRIQLWLLITAMMLAISVAIIISLLHNAEGRVESSDAQVVTEQAEKKEIAKEAQKALCGTKDTEIFDRDLCIKLAAAAQEPVELPQEKPKILGPSRAELVQAFRSYCSEGNNCRGADGADPTADDIAAAFVRFCSDGRCAGPAGEKGKDAEPLEYETVLAAVADICGTGVCSGPAGKDGANATQEMVLAAVQTVCANDACRGPAGADSTVPGPDGKPGEPGRGIADSYCQDTGLWQITYTDGVVDNDAGQCRADPVTGGPPSSPLSLNL